MSAATPPLVAAVTVKVSGQDLDPDLASLILEVRVEDDLVHPDSFVVKLSDPGLENIDGNTFEIGKEVEIWMKSPGGADDAAPTQPQKLIKGDIVALEPEFNDGGAFIVARGYDKSHKLNRTKNTKAYQNQTFGDIARAVIGAAGLSPGTVDDSGGPQDFVQQSAETDWDFLKRLADRIGNEVVAEDEKIHFRKAGSKSGGPKTLEWGKELHVFHPRLTGVQQVREVTVRSWDPKTKQAITSTKQAQPAYVAKIGIERSAVSSKLDGGKLNVGDRAFTTQAEADAFAQGVVDQLANAFVDATGRCVGDPDLHAGSKVNIQKVGTKFSGEYTLSSTTHVYGKGGYFTRFTISGKRATGVVDMMTPKSSRNWGESVVVGIVTNNSDPDNMGRVRVKYPSLGDETEGWWARVSSSASGKDRGLLMMPQPNEEVLIAFENNDPRKPYVIGSVWNAKDTPGNLVQKDGSFVLQSDKQIQMKAKDPIDIKGDKEFKLETTGAINQKSSNDFSLDAKGVNIKASTSAELKASTTITVNAGGSVSIKGAAIDVNASGALTLKASGVVTISGSQIMLG